MEGAFQALGPAHWFEAPAPGPLHPYYWLAAMAYLVALVTGLYLLQGDAASRRLHGLLVGVAGIGLFFLACRWAMVPVLAWRVWIHLTLAATVLLLAWVGRRALRSPETGT
ncbi:MAG TPA: hypothetical protein VIN09_04240 [Chloroflexota bacterium]